MSKSPPPSPDPKSSSTPGPRPQATWYRATSASSIGIEIAVCIVAGAGLGRYAEREWTHWAPWTTLLGFLIGLAAAVKALVRTTKQVKRELAAMELASKQRNEASDPKDEELETKR